MPARAHVGGGRRRLLLELIDRVWGAENDTSRGAVKAVVHTLRHKLGAPDLIETQHGTGYKMRRA
jgi:DNA-binding response OmpR family regulator